MQIDVRNAESPGRRRRRSKEEDVHYPSSYQEVVDVANPRKQAVVEDVPQTPDCPHTQAGVSM